MHPKPDRSNHQPNFVKTTENPTLDIGWNEGFLRDMRPYRVEARREEGVTSLTYFFPAGGLEGLTDAQFADLLEREGLLRYLGPRRSAYAMPFTDASGNSLWSVNVVVGAEGETFVDDLVELRPYRR